MVESSRRARITKGIPAGYRPWLHLLATAGSGVVVLVAAVLAIADLRWVELLVVPAMFVISNAGEWAAHKYLLHRRVKPFHILYDQHTPNHHVAYQYDDMSIESWRELKLVLIPAFGVAMICVAVSPFAIVAGFALTANCGWLVLVTAALYMVGYELSHMSYHLPKDHPVSRWRLVKWLREHHARHHDPRLMKKWNFNVTIPLWDWIVGTKISTAHFERLTGRTSATGATTSTGSTTTTTSTSA